MILPAERGYSLRLALMAGETPLVWNLSMRPGNQTKRESRATQYRGNVIDRAVYLIPNCRALEALELHDVCHGTSPAGTTYVPCLQALTARLARLTAPRRKLSVRALVVTCLGTTRLTACDRCGTSQACLFERFCSARLLVPSTGTNQSNRTQVAAPQPTAPSTAPATANCKPTPSRP